MNRKMVGGLQLLVHKGKGDSFHASAVDAIRELEMALVEYVEMVDHFIEMDALTPGGSNEGWAKRLRKSTMALLNTDSLAKDE